MLELLDIRKRFGALVALDGVNVRFSPGRVHGLLGENGAGKSTLMNVAYGMLKPDGGQIRMNGTPVVLRSPREAIAKGIGMVHQHFMLAGAMSVLDNVLLGDWRATQFLNRRRAADELAALAERLGWTLDPLVPVERLSVGQQQRVEILKALWRDARLLILDEPTAVLTPPEVEQLFGAVERLRDEGRSVVFISHKLGEVKRICDDLTVLRRGRVVWEGAAEDVSPAELANHMIGRDVETVTRATFSRRGHATPIPDDTLEQARLRLDNVTAANLHDVSFQISPGEILGIAGVDGNGQQELAAVVVGLRPPTRGRVLWHGSDVTAMSLEQRRILGFAHIPNDRKREALVPTMSVTENVMLKEYRDPPMSRFGVISWPKAAAVAKHVVDQFDVRAQSLDVAVATLSGGNQQKVVLAREFAIQPRVIVAMNPVRGLDVAATNFVYEQLLARRAAGAAILLISSELDELLALCDRIGVLYAGRLTMTNFPATGREAIGRLMAGIDLPAESR
ncbi:MAG: sugar transporter ATPase [Phycisphaerales bacterium]|nr:sugar transporter ATPase [Phycisphaerales bacterium]